MNAFIALKGTQFLFLSDDYLPSDENMYQVASLVTP